MLRGSSEEKLALIYAVCDTVDPAAHVGYSGNWRRRRRELASALRRGVHPNADLQADCTGIDGVRWVAVPLEIVPPGVSLKSREDYWRSLTRIPINIRGKTLRCVCLNPLRYRRRRHDPELEPLPGLSRKRSRN